MARKKTYTKLYTTRYVKGGFNTTTQVTKPNNFNKRYNLFQYCCIFSLCVIMGSWFFTGALDSRYQNSHTTYSYEDYKGDSNTIDVYDYSWTNKLKQLSNFKNVFDMPKQINRDDLRNDDNLTNFRIFYGSHVLLCGNLLGKDYWYCVNPYPTDNEWINYYRDVIKPWWDNSGQYIAKYFYVDSSESFPGNLHRYSTWYTDESVYTNLYENFLDSANYYINVIFSPINWLANAIYDFGVAFTFIVNW